MPAPENLLYLKDLPRATEDLARSTILAGRRLLSKSAAGVRSDSGLPQTVLAVRRSRLKLRFFLARQREQVLFFFVKTQQPALRPLETRLRAVLQAVPPPPDAAPGSTAAETTPESPPPLQCRLMVPPFLVLRPTTEELTRYAPAGTTAENGILFRVGPGEREPYVLGIRDPEAEQHAAAVYTAQTRQPLDSWQAAPFLALIETLRSYVAEETKATLEAELSLPSDPSKASDVHAAIYYFAQGYQSLTAEIARVHAEPLAPPLSALEPRYEALDYSADIALCVDRNGYFATAAEPQPVSIGMHMTVGRELGGMVIRITLKPPDFLIAGSLRDAFLGQLRSSLPLGVLQPLGLQQGSAWTDFLDSARERAVVFRIGRDKNKDIDVVVLPGAGRDGLRTFILRTSAVVDVNAQPIDVKLSGITVIYDSVAGSHGRLDDPTVAYFMRLAGAFKSWLSVLR